MKYGFIGFGHLAQAIYQGLKAQPIEFGYVSKSNENTELRAFESIEALAAFADVIWLCVKPQDLIPVLQALRTCDLAKKMVVSPVAGKSIHFIEGYLGADITIARIMPNLATAYKKSVTAYADNSETEITTLLKNSLHELGMVLELPERHFDLFTAIFGSGPAFLLEIMEVYRIKTLALGLSGELADELLKKLADGTMAYRQANTDKSSSELIDQIASKGGVTEAGLEVYHQHAIGSQLADVIEAARKKSAGLGE